MFWKKQFLKIKDRKISFLEIAKDIDSFSDVKSNLSLLVKYNKKFHVLNILTKHYNLNYLVRNFLHFIFLLTFFMSFSQKNIHHRWNNDLKKYVSNNGNVNYKLWNKNKSNLDAYINLLSKFPPEDKSSKSHKNIFLDKRVQCIDSKINLIKLSFK